MTSTAGAPRCEIESYLASSTDTNGRPLAFAPTTSQTRCKTHSWQWQPGAMLTSIDNLCPLGRIEEATEEALRKIAEAQRDDGFCKGHPHSHSFAYPGADGHTPFCSTCHRPLGPTLTTNAVPGGNG